MANHIWIAVLGAAAGLNVGLLVGGRYPVLHIVAAVTCGIAIALRLPA